MTSVSPTELQHAFLSKKMFTACCLGYVVSVRELLTQHPWLVDARCSSKLIKAIQPVSALAIDNFTALAIGDTPLVAACRCNQLVLVKLLLDRGADVKGATTPCRTALHVAAFRGHLGVVLELLHRGADVNTLPLNAFTPLLAAVGGNQVRVMETLLAHGADASLTRRGYLPPLHHAAIKGHVDAARCLLSHKPDLVHQLDDSLGYSPLHFAAQNGHRDVAAVLLAHGAQVGMPTRTEHLTPLYVTVKQNDCYELVELLLEHGASVTVAYVGHRSPLTAAALRRNVSILELLMLQPSADVNEPIENGRTLLGVAALAGEYNNVRLLLAEGADANARDTNGRTALEYAIDGNHGSIAALLAPVTTDTEMRNRKRRRSTDNYRRHS